MTYSHVELYVTVQDVTVQQDKRSINITYREDLLLDIYSSKTKTKTKPQVSILKYFEKK